MPIVVAVANPYTRVLDQLAQLPGQVTNRRTELGLTVAQAAGQIGVSASTLTAFEAGTSNYTKATLTDVLAWLAQNT